MYSAVKRLEILILLAIFVLLAVTNVAEATYRKPPFNGSIFGKRTNNIGDY